MALDRFLDNPGIQRMPRNQAEWRHWINEVAKWIADQQDVEANTTAASSALIAADTAQNSATAAARTSAYAVADPSGYVWRSDPAGVFPGGNPTVDITTTFYDQSGAQVAQQVLRGSLLSVSGNILISDPGTSDAPASGYSVAYTVINGGTDSVRADITMTLPDNSQTTFSVSWNSIDVSASGGTPATGGGK